MSLEEEIKQTKPFKNNKIKAIVNLHFTTSWLTTKQAKLFKPFGMSLQQYNILRILKGMHPQPATVKILIERMLDKNSNASRLVDKLHSKGLVERKPCISDRRKVQILITNKGLNLVSQLIDLTDNDNEIINLSEKEALLLSDLLDKIRQ